MLNYNEEIVQRLKKHNLTICTCESVTGGMISSNIVAVSGSSSVFLGGCVSYSEESKKNIIRVSENTIAKHGIVSAAVAKEMAMGAQKIFKSDVAVAITGDAGPNTEGKIGRAFLAIIVLEKIYSFELNSNEKSRNDIRLDLTVLSYKSIINVLNKINCK